MDIALDQAREVQKKGEVPVGAAIIFEGKIIVACGNASFSSQDPTAHAEIMAIREACIVLGVSRLDRCHLIVTLEPCPMCAAAISLARLHTVIFGAYDPKTGGVDHGPQIFNHKTCHHKPYVIGGVKEQECAALLTDFFKNKRE